jgi:TM2 domain-containing membrane protein YozV
MENRKLELFTPMNKVSSAYILWLGCFLSLNGLHRLYNGKIATGLLWLCTFGLFGVGQLVDLLLIPNMVEDYNTKMKIKMGVSANGVPLYEPVVATSVIKPSKQQLMVKLLKAAEVRNGKLSVTQGVMDTVASFSEVEAVLKEMLKSGYVKIDNHPVTGVVVYEFIEL